MAHSQITYVEIYVHVIITYSHTAEKEEQMLASILPELRLVVSDTR